TTLIIAPGEKIGQIYGLKALTTLDQTRPDGTRYISKADEGLYTIVDGRVVKKSDKQIQFTSDSYPFGDPNPKFNASFINSIGYKDIITLSFQIDWVHGSHLYNQTKEWMYRDGIHGDFDKPVTIDGQTGAFTAYWVSPYYNTFGFPYGSANNSTKDFFYEDASFVRLRNISLAFDISRMTNIRYFKKLQLVLTGRNIYTKTKYSGFDPEISSGPANSSFERGIDHSSLPNIKSYQVGLNIGL
ncbi:MAG: SusC/RagA family TonB-linked outer membrane protein, partial [Bacteroidota bacterium]|nr:SusC/RagA family TonB-linked outer membrane protein [Bacteroidota bacterium]